MSRVSYPPALDASDGPAYDPTDRPFVPAAGGAVTIFVDTFTDSAGTLLTAHTPDTVESPASGSWTVGATTFAIDPTGTELDRTSASANDTFAIFDIGISDGIVYTDGIANNVGLVFRHADNSNYWMLFRNSGGTGEILYERIAGSYNNRGSSSVGGGGAYRDWAVLFNGANITCYNASTSQITYGSAPASSDTGAGFQREAGAPPAPVSTDITAKNSTSTDDLP